MSSSENRSRGRLTFKKNGNSDKIRPKNPENIESSLNSITDMTKPPITETIVEDSVLNIVNGTGTIVTSGTIINGRDSKFAEQLQEGDAILIFHPASNLEEIRLITMVLSNVASSLSSPLSSNLTLPTSFSYVKSPENLVRQAKSRLISTLNPQEAKLQVFDACGIYGRVDQEVTRVKKPGAFGGYTILSTSSSSSSSSREHLLDGRCKVKSDRHCG